ncbi:MAG: hypothetical protein ACI9R3_002597 [Verrucomicrobiales bacterium]|jgi:hypothetical protein
MRNCLFVSLFLLIGLIATVATGRDYNTEILKTIEDMPAGGTYAKYRKELPESRRFDDLYQTVADLDSAITSGIGGRLKVNPDKAAKLSFCSSATYLLFGEVIDDLGVIKNKKLAVAVADVGDKNAVIHGKLDGVGIFGHWNADGPGTAVLFKKLDLGTNFTSYARAKPGDFLKIWWNENIGKDERGHLVVFLGQSVDGKSIHVWSSQSENSDGTSGYGRMWVEKTRIKRTLFSRLERPENLKRWLSLPEHERTSNYLVRIRKSGSTSAGLKKITGSKD